MCRIPGLSFLAISFLQLASTQRIRGNRVAKETGFSIEFPSVYTTTIELDRVPREELLSDLDLLDIDCQLSNSLKESVNATIQSVNATRNSTLCRVYSLVHSQRELDYMQSSSSGLFFEYDADSTEAITQRQALRGLSEGNPIDTYQLDPSAYSTIRGHSCFLDVDGMHSWLIDFVATAPSHLNVSLVKIGESYLKTTDAAQGYDIQALRITSASTQLNIPKAPMLILTGVHSREYSPPEVVRRWIQSFTLNYTDELKLILETTVIHWIPYVNPDGRVLAETTQPFRRKNLNPSAAGSEFCFQDEFGVDINRNFPFRWGRSIGSSGRGCTQTYRGSAPASEPETAAVVDYAMRIFPEAQRKPVDDFGIEGATGYDEDNTSGMFIDIHSFGNYYIFPWGFENSQTPNHLALATMVSKISHFTGYDSRGPGPFYTDPASGATDDFAYGSLGAAGMTWEIGTSFHQNCPTFENDMVQVNMDALTYTAKLAHRPYTLAQGPDITDFHLEPKLISPGDDVKISVTARDNALSNLPRASQQIQEIRVYFDHHPFSTTERFPFFSFDASLISPDGQIEVTLALSGIALGPHMVYAQAFDTDGYGGPLAAVVLNVESPPTETPTEVHSSNPTAAPSHVPSAAPTVTPSSRPTTEPTSAPTMTPSGQPTMTPTGTPTECKDSGSTFCSNVARATSSAVSSLPMVGNYATDLSSFITILLLPSVVMLSLS